MKNLYESLLDNEEALVNSTDNYLHIKEFLKENYFIKDNGKFTVHNNIVDIDGSIVLTGDISYLTDNTFKFGIIKGDFDLEGGANENLKSLKGGPKEVKGDFICNELPKLTSLKYCPEKIDGCFDCCDCDKIKNLKGIPLKIGGDVRIELDITTLEGGPKDVGGSYNIYFCDKLDLVENLKFLPNSIGQSLFLPKYNTKDKNEVISYLLNNVKVGRDVYIDRKKKKLDKYKLD